MKLQIDVWAVSDRGGHFCVQPFKILSSALPSESLHLPSIIRPSSRMAAARFCVRHFRQLATLRDSFFTWGLGGIARLAGATFGWCLAKTSSRRVLEAGRRETYCQGGSSVFGAPLVFDDAGANLSTSV